jgi:DNA modification methylase
MPLAGSPLSGASVAPWRLPTNTTTRQHAVHRWFNFIAGFSPELVWLCCERVGRKNATLLDPFAGCGTSLVAATQHGFSVAGSDRHPHA